MEWTGVKYELPNQSGVYLASIHIQWPHGVQVTSTAAFYNVEENKWYKYDPFDGNYQPKEEITGNGKVVGWMKNMMSYFG